MTAGAAGPRPPVPKSANGTTRTVVRSANFAVGAALVLAAAGCARGGELARPPCEGGERLALLAQAMPGAAYVPCVAEVPEGWSFSSLEVDSTGASFALSADAAGGADVRIELVDGCDVTGATPNPPRAEGVRTWLRLRSVDPRFAGTLSDTFAGGCVTYDFDFPRGPHIELVEELQESVQLFPRRQLRAPATPVKRPIKWRVSLGSGVPAATSRSTYGRYASRTSSRENSGRPGSISRAASTG